MLFVWYSPDRTKRFWLCLGGLLIFPNYYLISIYYYTDIFAMVFTLGGVIAYLRKWHWVGVFVAGGGCLLPAIYARISRGYSGV
jgi:hypothetical protein